MDAVEKPPGDQRVLVIGDLHANTGAAFATIDYAASVGATHLLQAGDFGWWPRDPGGQRFLLKVERRLSRHGLNLWWVDGNHEDFERLAARPISEDGRRQVSDHIWHLPRGYRWAWNRTVWLAVGGAVSVDKEFRTQGKTWFDAEELTVVEADRIVADGPADVVLSHDAPLGVPFLRAHLRQDRPAWRRESEWPIDLLVRSDDHQRRLRAVVDGVAATRVFHGHYHVRYSDVLATAHGEVLIEGLGTDTDRLAARLCLVDAEGRLIPAT